MAKVALIPLKQWLLAEGWRNQRVRVELEIDDRDYKSVRKKLCTRGLEAHRQIEFRGPSKKRPRAGFGRVPGVKPRQPLPRGAGTVHSPGTEYC